MDSLNTGIAWIKQITRELSRVRFEKFLGEDKLEIEDCNTAEVAVHGPLMAIILIYTPELRIIFRTHFESTEAEPWTSRVYRASPSQVGANQSSELFKEFCNLTAGALKHECELHGLAAGISLPIVSRGFDELFFESADGKRIFTDYWILKSAEGRVVCSTHVELRDPSVFLTMKPGKLLSQDLATGEVEDL